MPTIIISQNQPASAEIARQLAGQLRDKFPQATIHETVGAVVSPGDDYEKAIKQAVNDSELLIVIVTAGWNANDPEDYDTIAIQSALDNEKRIVPVLVDDATMPADLPESLSGLKRRMGSRINESEPDFSSLLTAMEQLLGASAAKAATPPPLVPQNKPTPVDPPPTPQQQAPPQTPWQPPSPQGQMPPPPPPQSPYGQPSGPYPPQGAPYPPQGYGGPSGSPLGNSQPHKIVGGLLMLLSALIVISFFVLPWFSFTRDGLIDAASDFVDDSSYADRAGLSGSDFRLENSILAGVEGCKYTAFQLMSRGDGSDECGESDDSEGDVDQPGLKPLLEYSLAIIPIFALIIGFVGFQISQDYQLDTGKLRTALTFGILLAIVPILWQALYTPTYRQWNEDVVANLYGEDSIRDISGADARDEADFVVGLFMAGFGSGYQTIMQSILPLLIAAVGFGGVLIAQRKQPPYPPPYPPGQQMPPYQQQPPPRY